MAPSINADRLADRINQLAEIGAAPDNGTTRLALTDADKAGRDQVVAWMREAGLSVATDRFGNIFAQRKGRIDSSPIMTGSHIDTVRTAGAFDGCYGVLAGLEVCMTLDDHGIETQRPISVAIFTNEEGVRFQPDMMGSLAFVGGLDEQTVYESTDADGIRFGDELERIGYAGGDEVSYPQAFIELHIEQGPVLEASETVIGAVENLQGISWQEVRVTGQANHAGTTPMSLRRDAGYFSAALTTWLHDYAIREGNGQVATVGCIDFKPGAINVVPGAANLTVDLRNPDEARLKKAERCFSEYLAELSEKTGLKYEVRRLARFEPVTFDTDIVACIEQASDARGLSHQRMTSGAGHDAQMLARVCPSAMIFVPSIDGVSHNPREYTEPAHLAAGANILLDCMLKFANAEG